LGLNNDCGITSQSAGAIKKAAAILKNYHSSVFLCLSQTTQALPIESAKAELPFLYQGTCGTASKQVF